MQGTPTSRKSNPRSISKAWMIVPYGLAALYVASVVFGLFNQHRLNQEYRNSFQYPIWAERNGRYANLYRIQSAAR